MNRRSFDPMDDGVSLQSTLLAGHVSYDDEEKSAQNEAGELLSRTRDSSLVWQVETEGVHNLNLDAIPNNEMSLDEEHYCGQHETVAPMPRWREMGKENVPPSPKALAASSSYRNGSKIYSSSNHLGIDHLKGWSFSTGSISGSRLADSGFDADEQKTGVMLAKQLEAFNCRPHSSPLESSEPASFKFESTTSPAHAHTCTNNKRKLNASNEVSSTTQRVIKRRALQVDSSSPTRLPASNISRIPISIDRMIRKRQASIEASELAPAPQAKRERPDQGVVGVGDYRGKRFSPKKPVVTRPNLVQSRPPKVMIDKLNDMQPGSSINRIKPAIGGAGCTPYHRRPGTGVIAPTPSKRQALRDLGAPVRAQPNKLTVTDRDSKTGRSIYRRPGTPHIRPSEIQKTHVNMSTKEVLTSQTSAKCQILQPARLVIPKLHEHNKTRKSNEVARMARRFENIAAADRKRPVASPILADNKKLLLVPGQRSSTGLVQRAKSALIQNANRPPPIKIRSPSCLKIGSLRVARERFSPLAATRITGN
ncbi:hypothetical protein QAD02_012037 [Eretmocerus hayati]|uniref:Uncharacterized protein n=1 Tax=Eretmocerus hayati TaxID=131215 RepID=A0ACC2NYK6_9HYME|nr:hypothetical protein QAD02_012037 [Eretmocerus hayati]